MSPSLRGVHATVCHSSVLWRPASRKRLLTVMHLTLQAKEPAGEAGEAGQRGTSC